MTNDKAVKLLHRIADEQFDGIHGDERREALEMAVRALEPNLSNNGSICTKTVGNDEDRTTNDLISRKMAIDFIDYLLSQPCTGDNGDFARGIRVGYYRSRIGIKYLPFAQPEEVVPHKNYKYLSDYWCECGWHLGKKGDVKYCSNCGRKVKWNG